MSIEKEGRRQKSERRAKFRRSEDLEKSQILLDRKQYADLGREVLAKNMTISELEAELNRLKVENSRLKDMLHNILSKRLSEIK